MEKKKALHSINHSCNLSISLLYFIVQTTQISYPYFPEESFADFFLILSIDLTIIKITIASNN